LVEAPPQVSLSTFDPVCANESALVLSGGAPSGGSYSGPGVSGGSFDPGLAGVGSHSVVYTASNTAGCVESATQVVVVESVPQASLTPFDPVCANESVLTLSGGTPSGGSYGGPGVSGGSFDPTLAGVGSHSIVYTVSNAAGCTDSATQVMIVNPVPSAPNIQVNDDTLFTLVSGAHQWYLDGQAISGAADSIWIALQDGIYTVNLISAEGCISDPSEEVSVVATSLISMKSTRLEVFPTPAEEEITVVVGGLPSGLYQWEVIDTQGRRVVSAQRERGANEAAWQIAVGNWPSGIYLLTIRSIDGGRWQARLIRQ